MNEIWKQRPIQALGAIVVVVLVLVWVVQSRSHLTPEDQIRSVIKAMVKGAEEHDIKPFRRYLSDQLQDQSGLGKKDVVQRLRMLFLRHPSIHLQILSLQVQGSSDQIRNVNLDLLMSSTHIPQEKGHYEIVFKKEDGDWKVFSMEWGEGYGK